MNVMAAQMDQYVEILQTNLVGTLQKVAKGEKNIPLIPAADDQDEITPAINTMITTIDSIVGEIEGLITDAQEGNLKNRGKPDQFVGAYKDIIIGINNMLQAITTPLNEALRVADLFAHAKFGSRFDDLIEVKGDLIALKEGLNTVGRELSFVIRDVSEQVGALTASAEEAAASVEEVTAGAASVAQSSSLVSENTESSVKAVEQVLTAMEELSTSVATVATKVDAVSRLSQETNTLSTKGVAKVFCRPVFHVILDGEKVIWCQPIRKSPCGSTDAAARELNGQVFDQEAMNRFALSICHNCRAPPDSERPVTRKRPG